MIVIEKRKAARAAYWAVVSFFGLSTVGAAMSDFASDRLLTANRGTVETLNAYVAAALLAALAGYFWPGGNGYPTKDKMMRAVALGAVLGVIFVALTHVIRVDVSFWSGFKFGFLTAAVVQPGDDA